jgi:hypothetical protein
MHEPEVGKPLMSVVVCSFIVVSSKTVELRMELLFEIVGVLFSVVLSEIPDEYTTTSYKCCSSNKHNCVIQVSLNRE